jgi:hypothetical protein
MKLHQLTRVEVTGSPTAWSDERGDPRGARVCGSDAARRTWRNPCYGVRVALVGATWMAPGVLAGLLTALCVPVPSDPATAGFLGAVLGGAVGAGMELLDSTGSC